MSGGYFTQQVPLSPQSRKVDRLCVWNVISLWEYSHNESKIYVIVCSFKKEQKVNSEPCVSWVCSVNILRWYFCQGDGKRGVLGQVSFKLLRPHKRNEWWKMSKNLFSRCFWTFWPLQKFQKAKNLYSNQFCCEFFHLCRWKAKEVGNSAFRLCPSRNHLVS